jgi:hypothetical protein
MQFLPARLTPRVNCEAGATVLFLHARELWFFLNDLLTSAPGKYSGHWMLELFAKFWVHMLLASCPLEAIDDRRNHIQDAKYECGGEVCVPGIIATADGADPC